MINHKFGHMMNCMGESENTNKSYVLLVLLFLGTVFIFVEPVAAAANAQIQNDTSYFDSLGYFHVVGEVRNTGDVWLQYVRVTGTLKNASGQIVDVTFTFTRANYLPPDQKAPFDLLETDKAKSAKTASYTLVLDFQQATTSPQNVLTIQNTSASTDSRGYLTIVGEVKNNGAQVSNYTEIIATFYDSTGKVIHVDFTFTSPNAVPAGQTYGFKLIGPNQPISGRVSSWILIAEGTQYTSIPEFPWPTIMILAVLSLMAVALRRKTPNV